MSRSTIDEKGDAVLITSGSRSTAVARQANCLLTPNQFREGRDRFRSRSVELTEQVETPTPAIGSNLSVSDAALSEEKSSLASKTIEFDHSVGNRRSDSRASLIVGCRVASRTGSEVLR